MSAARAVLVVGACLLAMAAATAPAASAAGTTSTAGTSSVTKASPRVTAATTSPAALAKWSDSQLAGAAARWDAEAVRIGESLLTTASQRGEIERTRDTARTLLAQFLAESYKRSSSDGGMFAQVLASGSFMEAMDRVQVASTVADYHQNLIGSLDGAESRLDLSSVQRARLISRLSFVQARVVDVRGEQGRRATIRDAHAADRARQRADAQQRKLDAARASAAATGAAVGALVGSTGASPFVAASGSPSAMAIDAYLMSKGSPMAGQGAAFVTSGTRWGVDPRLLVAIAGAESNFGQITCGPNNAWGWACPNDPADFATWADGIDTVTEGLRNYYLDEGRTSVSLIQQKYCPVGAANDPTGLNNHWSTNVTKFLLEQGGNPAQVGPGPSGSSALQLPTFGLTAVD